MNINTILLQPRNKEASIQVAIVNYLRLKNIELFYTPNETNIKNPATRILKKLMGLQSGVSDLCLLLPQRRIVFIEIKTDKGKQSVNQKAWQSRVEMLGFEYYIWRNVDDAIYFIENKQ